MVRSVAVIGLGLLGGSICKKIRELSPGTAVFAYGRNQEILRTAKEEGTIDAYGTVAEMNPADVELVVVATPVATSTGIIRTVLDGIASTHDTLVIDVGSVKQGICQSVSDHPAAFRFIGCHPMAGSEKSGYYYSDATILEDASVIITPVSGNRSEDIGKIEQFWKWMGGKTLIVDPETHDRTVAMTSHLPHMLSSCLMELLGNNDTDNTASYLPFSGNGLRDMTRLAGGSPDLWSEIVSMNKQHIVDMLDQYMELMTEVRKMVLHDSTGKETWDHFQKAREYRMIMEDQ